MKPEYVKKELRKRKKHTKLIRRIEYVILLIVIYNICIVGISAILNKSGASIFGFKAYVITTESMSPNINAGDVVIIKKVEENKLNVEDVISFKQDNGIITHRIIEINKVENGRKEYTTKGDNNNIQDSKNISYKDIEGKKILRVPYLGKIINFLQDEVYIIILTIILLLVLLHNQEVEEKNVTRREKKKIEDEKFDNKKID